MTVSSKKKLRRGRTQKEREKSFLHIKSGKELQNHRMVQIGKELQRSSGPTPFSRRATKSRLPRTVSRQLLAIFRYGDFATSLVKL